MYVLFLTERLEKSTVLEQSSHRYRACICPKEMSPLRFVGSRCFSLTPCPSFLLTWLSSRLVFLGSEGWIPFLSSPSSSSLLPRSERSVTPWGVLASHPTKHRHRGSCPLIPPASCLLPGPSSELSLAHYSSVYSFQCNIFIKLLLNSSGTQSLPHANLYLFRWQH